MGIISSQNQDSPKEKVDKSETIICPGISLVGPLKGLKKHGEFYYIIQKEYKIIAGQYDNDKKIGFWREACEEVSTPGCEVFYQGQYKNGKRIGKWMIFSEGEMIDGGQYDQNGKKTGLWTDVDYSAGAPYLMSFGLYKDGFRVGKWKTIQGTNITYTRQFGGGLYNKMGMKQGKWIELHKDSQSNTIMRCGEYKNGLCIGLWQIQKQIYFSNNLEVIGGGIYDEFGMKQGYWIDYDFKFKFEKGKYKDNKRIGEWIILDQKYFHLDLKINCTEQGEYVNGKRFGFWSNIKIFVDLNLEIKCGGNYDSNGEKIGEWKEFHKQKKTIIHIGNYKCGQRVGLWEIFKNNLKIGGGNYDQKGLKQGLWIEGKKKNCYKKGEYQNGLRTGLWQYFKEGQVWQKSLNKYSKQGQYNEQGAKDGFWLDKRFTKRSGYYQNGYKVGLWDTSRMDSCSIQYQHESNYDEDGFLSSSIVNVYDNGYESHYEHRHKNGFLQFYHGYSVGFSEYRFTFDSKGLKQGVQCDTKMEGSCKDDYKIGQWISKNENFTKEYSEQGIECGDWEIEPSDLFCQERLDSRFLCDIIRQKIQWTLEGEYQNGLRIGKWTLFSPQNEIGGGYYNKKGFKFGKWIDPLQDYSEGHELTCTGEYQNELRVGYWNILYLTFSIGGGYYDEQGLKQGQWVEPSYNFSFQCQFTFSGNYLNGIRDGRWLLLFKKKQIGGGNYNQNGKKEGEWIEVEEGILVKDQMNSFQSLQTFKCYYQNGIRC